MTPMSGVLESSPFHKEPKDLNCHKHSNRLHVDGLASPDESRGQQEHGNDTRENDELLLAPARMPWASPTVGSTGAFVAGCWC